MHLLQIESIIDIRVLRDGIDLRILSPSYERLSRNIAYNVDNNAMQLCRDADCEHGQAQQVYRHFFFVPLAEPD